MIDTAEPEKRTEVVSAITVGSTSTPDFEAETSFTA